MFEQYEVPVAYSMVNLAQLSTEPFQEFMCYWTAFNSIYSTLAEREGFIPQLKTRKDGTLKSRQNGSVLIPEIIPALSEHGEIELALSEFDTTLRHCLLDHPTFVFFVYRIPSWHGSHIEFDVLKQRVNGVLNVKYTSSVGHPVWSPIDIQAYERYLSGHPNSDDVDLLVKQLMYVIYTVRNNTFHGGKRADDANDLEVVQKALPLLKIIVEHFIHRVNQQKVRQAA